MNLEIKKFNCVTSTNDEAIKLIKNKKKITGLVVAKQQKKGRGTMGKKWVSKKGNIFVSIYFQIKSKNLNIEKLSLLNPILIKNVLEKYSKYKINIKWPNDLLIKGYKLCGILQEVIYFKSKKYLIIGIGINTLFAPENKRFKSISLASCSDQIIKNEDILTDVKKSYESFISDITKYKISYIKKNMQNLK